MSTLLRLSTVCLAFSCVLAAPRIKRRIEDAPVIDASAMQRITCWDGAGDWLFPIVDLYSNNVVLHAAVDEGRTVVTKATQLLADKKTFVDIGFRTMHYSLINAKLKKKITDGANTWQDESHLDNLGEICRENAGGFKCHRAIKRLHAIPLPTAADLPPWARSKRHIFEIELRSDTGDLLFSVNFIVYVQ